MVLIFLFILTPSGGRTGNVAHQSPRERAHLRVARPHRPPRIRTGRDAANAIRLRVGAKHSRARIAFSIYFPHTPSPRSFRKRAPEPHFNFLPVSRYRSACRSPPPNCHRLLRIFVIVFNPCVPFTRRTLYNAPDQPWICRFSAACCRSTGRRAPDERARSSDNMPPRCLVSTHNDYYFYLSLHY